MQPRAHFLFLLLGTLLTLNSSQIRAADPPFAFRDVAKESGLLPAVDKIMGHAAGWGDIDGDGWIDLYVGTFHYKESKPNMMFRNQKGKFTLDTQQALRFSGRPTGCIFADLDNDGDLDLFVGSMPSAEGTRLAQRLGYPMRGCSMFRNDGKGKFTDVSKGNGACPSDLGGRSATVLDYDGDGLLDLLVGSDPFPGYNGTKSKSSRLFRNKGKLQFEDVSRKVGIPENVPGLGVATADVNNDGWPDFFLCSSAGGNRLFINDQKGKFTEAPDSPRLFQWDKSGGSGGDDMICGVVISDVNRDGLPDIILGQHFSTPWLKPVANRLYIHRGIKNGQPKFEDVTEKVGLIPLPMKAPHVEIQDFDNDGWPDVSTSMVKFADGKKHPIIFRHLGLKDGLPRFRADGLSVNDFPNNEDKALKRSGPFFEHMIKERKIIYSAPGPIGDFDNDGRLDIFMANWWVEAPSMLLRNETKGGNWLQVQVQGDKGVNRMGIGTKVKIYPAGKLGEASALLGAREIATGYGYASGQPAYAHFGLGKNKAVDLEIVFPHGKGKVTQKSVKANQRLTVKR